MVQTLLGTDNSSMKVETIIHHTKQPQLSVRVSMIESLNEEIENKLSSLSVCCSSFQSLVAANWEEKQPKDVCALGTFNRMWLAEWVLYVEDEYVEDEGCRDGCTEMTSLQRSIECSDVFYWSPQSTKVETNFTPITGVGYASTETLGKSSALSLTADSYISSVKTMYWANVKLASYHIIVRQTTYSPCTP